ncbi:kelch-like protein 15 [Grus japonensis]|uniref:Kelch-like protein 15 n=1 Tax=Grus japonensis TaxID=30415 RepID=A0ABC9W0F0_GRUJA
MRERDQDKIHLKGLTATGFSHVLQFMYYGTIELSMNTVHEILQAAMYVQLIEVVKFCCSFLLAKICLENCAEIMRLLDDFGVNIEGVREKLDSFLLENFVPLMSRPDFLSYLSFEKLMSYLDNDHLSRFPEIELYEAVQAWLRHDRRRWRHTDTIIQNIRFCLMTPSSVFEKVKTSEFYRYSRQLRHEVDQAMNYFHSVHQQPLMEMKSNKIRSAKPQTAVFRGMIGHSMVGKNWGQMASFMLHPKCLDMTQDRTLGYEWQTCLFHGLSLLLELLGDKWEFVDPYPVNKYGHEGTVLGKKLYITGGITSSSTSKQVCVFDPSKEGTVEQRTRRTQVVTNCWENKCKMNYARCFHKMISYNGKLYVFGGVCVILRASFESQGCPSTEVYDPDTDQWTILASMPIGRSGHGVAVLDKQIMVLGGLCYNGHYSDSILTFDPEENKWKEDEYPRMPCKLDGLQVCSLHFPEYVLEHVRRCS